MLRYHERAMNFSTACVDMDMHDHKNDVSLLRKKKLMCRSQLD